MSTSRRRAFGPEKFPDFLANPLKTNHVRRLDMRRGATFRFIVPIRGDS